MVAHRCDEVGGLATGRSLTSGEVRSWTVVSSMGTGGWGGVGPAVR
jgi:hypothetical protein